MRFSHYKPLKLREVLELDTFSGCKVVAGKEGLSNQIHSVTVAEVPDAPNWIIGGELVVSTGYYIKNNSSIQKEWFESLIKKGASALAIKPDRFLGKTNNELKQLADKYKFPLIELPHDIVWPDIIKNVTEKLFTHQHKIISRTEDIHNSLTELVLNGGGLEEIAQTLANLIKAPVIVEDFQVNILSTCIPEGEQNSFDEILSLRSSDIYVKKFKNSRAYRESIAKRNKKVFSIFTNIDEDNRISQKVMPVVANNVLYGFLSVIETEAKKVNEIDVLALEHGATTIALEMMMERIKIEYSNQEKSTLMNELIKGDIKSAISSYINNKITNYEILKPSVVLVMSINNNDQSWIDKNNEFFFRERYDKKIAKYIEKQLQECGYKSFVNLQGNQCIMLVGYPENINKISYMEQLKLDCNKLLSNLMTEFPQNDYIIGIGEPYFNIETLKEAYEKATTTVQLSQKFFGFNIVSVYNELGVLKLLSLVDNQSEIENFCIDLIGNLIEYDKNYNDRMCDTLKTYLDNNGNNSQTSKDLFIHPNTLNYRVKKISKILGLDLKSSQVRFNLFLALSIKKIYMEDTG